VTRQPEEDHVANQIKYLRQSKCFQKSDSLTCVTCHDPHRPHDTVKSAAAPQACLQCHAPQACTDRPNLPVAVRDNCIGCHMPQRVWMNVHFHTEDDRYVPPIRRYQHRIAVDRIARSEVLLNWLQSATTESKKEEASRLTADLVGYWLEESTRRRSEYRFLAAIGAAREAIRLDPPAPLDEKARIALRTAIDEQTRLDTDLIEAFHEAREQRVLKAMDRLEGILARKPDWAVAHNKLGALSALTGQTDRAIRHLESVSRYDPDNASGLAMLGWMAYLDGRAADATEFYRRALEIEPFDAKLNYHWGLALLRLSRWPDAEVHFREAMRVEPLHAGAAQGLSHALREQGQTKPAIQFARRAARLTQFENPDVLATLAEAYAAGGRSPEAAAAAVKALAIESTQPLSADARRRMEELRENPNR
jgi:tetratricopeptide (TPR) repeat protein